jgi:hypothetical protein
MRNHWLDKRQEDVTIRKQDMEEHLFFSGKLHSWPVTILTPDFDTLIKQEFGTAEKPNAPGWIIR